MNPIDRPAFNPRLACPWPRKPRLVNVGQIAPAELDSWIIHNDDQVIVVNKPGDIICHPSKDGPWSSLAGAVRERFGLAAAHLVFRLDRETSGVVVLAKTPAVAGRLQAAMQRRRVAKTYLAIMTGELAGPVTVNQPLGPDEDSPVYFKTCVRPDGKTAVTHFTPISRAGGLTLARVVTETGRMHQIRAHAQWLGHSLAGDKVYGPSARYYLDFLDNGWTPALEEKLLLPRQALHCAEIDLRKAGLELVFSVELPGDLRAFCAARGIAVR
ncbi:MAG: RluA family pseudouridine synthase [Elusimicrobiales bacterium]|nr:RluA family pseudouridine synthase [Elusimicrobiales bacterium]